MQKKIYGEPDHVSYFVFPDNKKQEIYWWGPIFLMFSNDQISQIGGWPSRIGKKNILHLCYQNSIMK